MKALAQSYKCDNQFRGIAKRGVEQRTNAGTDMGCQMLGGSSQQTRQRNNGKSSRHKDQ